MRRPNERDRSGQNGQSDNLGGPYVALAGMLVRKRIVRVLKAINDSASGALVTGYQCGHKYADALCYNSKAAFTAEAQRTQSSFSFSLSVERSESEKQHAFGQNVLNESFHL